MLLCIYACDPEMAQFGYFVLLLFHLAGRGGEVAAIPFENVRAEIPPEFDDSLNSTDHILQFRLWRQKTAHVNNVQQDLSVFVHKDDLLRCATFMMGYSMVMDDEPQPSKWLLPNFHEHLDHDDPSETTDDTQETPASNSPPGTGNGNSSNRRPRRSARKTVSDYVTNLLNKLLSLSDFLSDFEEEEAEDTGVPPSSRFNFNPRVASHGFKVRSNSASNPVYTLTFVLSLWLSQCFSPWCSLEVSQLLSQWFSPWCSLDVSL